MQLRSAGFTTPALVRASVIACKFAVTLAGALALVLLSTTNLF